MSEVSKGRQGIRRKASVSQIPLICFIKPFIYSSTEITTKHCQALTLFVVKTTFFLKARQTLVKQI